jgi:hypothetical protein
MRAIIKLTNIYAMSLQDILFPAIDLSKIFIVITLRNEVTLRANYCMTFFLDIVLLAADA